MKLPNCSSAGWFVLAALDLYLASLCSTGPWPIPLAAIGIALATLLFETMAAILVLEHTIPEFVAILS